MTYHAIEYISVVPLCNIKGEEKITQFTALFHTIVSVKKGSTTSSRVGARALYCQLPENQALMWFWKSGSFAGLLPALGSCSES